jgi:hypothetical protein
MQKEHLKHAKSRHKSLFYHQLYDYNNCMINISLAYRQLMYTNLQLYVMLNYLTTNIVYLTHNNVLYFTITKMKGNC